MTPSRIALVTGGSRNLGRASALALARRGYDVVVHGRADLDAAESVADEVRALDRRAWTCVGDVGNPDDVALIREQIADEAGRVDVLVNNAAVRPRHPFRELSPPEWSAVVATILDGAYLCSRAFVPAMADAGWGRVVNVAGVRALAGDVDRAHVVAAKHGVVGLTKALALEFASVGVTVNAVSPGTIMTDRDRQDPTRAERRAMANPSGRIAEADDVAEVIAFLASGAARHVTGQVVSVSGGEDLG